jgi:hypothetical protein
MKAIDFVFEEGRKILAERRERRKADAAAPENKEKEPAKETALVDPRKEAGDKQELLSTKIDEIRWKHHEQDVRHLVNLLETHSRNYQIASEQYAKWGSALVPPIVVHTLTEAENSMIETLHQLEVVLSKVYKKDIPPTL